jgi:hypothetical protein
MSEQEVEELAEKLSWTSGEMTRYSESAVDDHNRWSWRGDGRRDGHGETIREQFRKQARLMLSVKAGAWDEGYRQGVEDVIKDWEPADNPYRSQP